MAITILRINGAISTETSTVALTHDATGADTIVIGVGWYGGGVSNIPAISDGSGNTYRPLTTPVFDVSNETFAWWYANASTGPFTAISTFRQVTLASSYCSMLAYALKGVAPGNPLDDYRTAQRVPGGPQATLAFPTSYLPALTNTFVLGGLASDGAPALANSVTISDPTMTVHGWIGATATGLGIAGAYVIQTTPVAVQPTWTGDPPGYLMSALVGIKSADGQPPGPPPGETHKTPYTIAPNQVPSPLSNFTVVVTGTASHSVHPGGYDVRPFVDAACTIPITTYQLAKWNNTTKAFTLWVKLATAATDTVIYIGQGDPALTTDGSSTTAWDTDYRVVTHCGNGTAVDLRDVSGHGNDGIPGSAGITAVAGPGVVGGGFRSSGIQNSNSYIPATQNIVTGQAITFGGWFQTWGMATGLYGKWDTTDYDFTVWVQNTRNIWGFVKAATIGSVNSGVTALDGIWNFIAIGYNGANIWISVNGAPLVTAALTGNMPPLPNSRLGWHDWLQAAPGFAGAYSETFCIAGNRSAAWPVATYRNQSSTAFWTVGSTTPVVPPVVPAPTISNLTPNSGNVLSTTNTIGATLTGTGFSIGLAGGNPTISFSGSGVTASAIGVASDSSIQFNIAIAPGAATGARILTLTTDGGSATTIFTVTIPAPPGPTITSLVPSSGQVSPSTDTLVTGVILSGSGFSVGLSGGLPGISFSGSGVTAESIIPIGDGGLVLIIRIAAGSAVGARTLTLTTDGGTATTTFTVTSPVVVPPTITNLNPASGDVLTTTNTIAATLTGTGFAVGTPTIGFSGTGVTATSINVTSDTTIQFNIQIAPGSAATARTLTLTTNNGAASTTFTVTTPAPVAPTITSLSPASGNVLTTTNTLGAVMTGAGFSVPLSGGNPSITISGTGVTVNSIVVDSDNMIHFNIVIAPGAAATVRTLTITTDLGSATTNFTVTIPPPVGTKGAFQIIFRRRRER